jgi:flagellar assembly factor FliW
MLDHPTTAPPTTLYLPQGIPGFPELHELRTEPWGGPDSPFSVLAATEPAVQFVATAPGVFFPRYTPVVPAEVRAALDLGQGAPLILVILTLGPTPAETTANLLGPLVINPGNGQARQVVLGGTDWSPVTPLVGGWTVG